MGEKLEQIEFDFKEDEMNALRKTGGLAFVHSNLQSNYRYGLKGLTNFVRSYEGMVNHLEIAKKCDNYPEVVYAQMKDMVNQLKPIYETYCKIAEGKDE